MSELPSHIETYLSEAGLTALEILIVKRMIEENTLTLRQLAAKTGKSTGALDQAMKKLIRKKIISKEVINDSPKYVLVSLDAINAWVKREAEQQQNILKRKQENFESFVTSMKESRDRPEMEHFEGLEGLKTAYKKLLEVGEEQLCYKPITIKEEDDPLRDFFVQYFRQRHRRGAFLRTISQNTPLGRRYQSRDIFEYRDTMLADEEEAPVFEKIISGDVVACMNHEKQTASFVHYPEMAEMERIQFEKEWKRLKAAAKESAPKEETTKPDVDLQTKTWSGLREFFLSRRSIAIMAMLGVISAGITYGFYIYNYNTNLERVRENVKGIAATGALYFNAEAVNKISGPEDVGTVNYENIVKKLQEIRINNPEIEYAYIFRPTSDSSVYIFLADADSLHPDDIVDLNEDGIIDDADELNWPGDEYIDDNPGKSALSRSQESPASDASPQYDQWGIWISGHAPIKDSQGNTVAVIGVDRPADDISNLSKGFRKSLLVFITIFCIFLLVRLLSIGKSGF